MLRIRKLTDYAFVVLVDLTGKSAEGPRSAHAIADSTRVPLPTVAKVLQQLTSAGLVSSMRGARGGYLLGTPPEEVSVIRVIEAMEGPLGLTECANPENDTCSEASHCALHGHWPLINAAVRGVLADLCLTDLSRGPRNLGSVERLERNR
jgi:FeS assembly SUF system regulator